MSDPYAIATWESYNPDIVMTKEAWTHYVSMTTAVTEAFSPDMIELEEARTARSIRTTGVDSAYEGLVESGGWLTSSRCILVPPGPEEQANRHPSDSRYLPVEGTHRVCALLEGSLDWSATTMADESVWRLCWPHVLIGRFPLTRTQRMTASSIENERMTTTRKVQPGPSAGEVGGKSDRRQEKRPTERLPPPHQQRIGRQADLSRRSQAVEAGR